MARPNESMSGVTLLTNEGQVDHMMPRKPSEPGLKSGTNSYKSAQLLSRPQNRGKSNKMF
jgi:hypothetical protein